MFCSSNSAVLILAIAVSAQEAPTLGIPLTVRHLPGSFLGSARQTNPLIRWLLEVAMLASQPPRAYQTYGSCLRRVNIYEVEKGFPVEDISCTNKDPNDYNPKWIGSCYNATNTVSLEIIILVAPLGLYFVYRRPLQGMSQLVSTSLQPRPLRAP